MGLGSYFANDVKNPFRMLSNAKIQKILTKLGGLDYQDSTMELVEFLSDSADTQVYTRICHEMEEIDIWYMGVLFFQQNARKFARGFRAYCLNFQDVQYIWVERSVDHLIARIRRDAKRYESKENL